MCAGAFLFLLLPFGFCFLPLIFPLVSVGVLSWGEAKRVCCDLAASCVCRCRLFVAI